MATYILHMEFESRQENPATMCQQMAKLITSMPLTVTPKVATLSNRAGTVVSLLHIPIPPGTTIPT